MIAATAEPCVAVAQSLRDRRAGGANMIAAAASRVVAQGFEAAESETTT